MSLTRIGEPWQRCRKKSASGRKLVAERLASTRPQAKTAARKAFEQWWDVKSIIAAEPLMPWLAWQAGWRAARGCKPTTREK